MNKKDYNLIAESIWRSGFIKDPDKKRQEAREKMRHLIAGDIAGGIKKDHHGFDENEFFIACGIKY